MSYFIGFSGDDMDSIFQVGGEIFLCGREGLTVKVPSKDYHQRMRAWCDDRMQHPLVFMNEAGTVRCTMTAHGDRVEVELVTIDNAMNVKTDAVP